MKGCVSGHETTHLGQSLFIALGRTKENTDTRFYN